MPPPLRARASRRAASTGKAAKGTYTATFVLQNRDAELELGLNVVRSATYAKRLADAPRALPAGTLRLQENAKCLAQQALQKAGVKRAFEGAFPAETHDRVQAALAAMVTDTKAGGSQASTQGPGRLACFPAPPS